MLSFDRIDGESNGCFDQEYSPLCFCRSSYQYSILTDLFLAKLFLSQCDDSLPLHHCYQSRFHPPSFHLTQLIPKLANLSYCLEDIHCLHTLHSIQHCRQCQLIPSLLIHNNNSYRTDACFNLCERNTSCGFLCLNQPIIISIYCNICRGQRQNVSCRCIKTKQSLTCLQSSYEITTQRWMQKRGFPAAGILALIILVVILLIIVIKLIYRQLDILDKRQNESIHCSILPNQNRQLSPSYPHKPQILPIQSQPLIIDIHRCDEKNELSILLLEKTLKD